MLYKDFIKLVSDRYSCRSYLDKDVPEKIIKNCLEAARLSPSACNKQPCRFIIIKDKTIKKRICSEGLLPGIPMPWLQSAPVIAAICTKTSLFTHKIAPFLSGINYHLIDAGIAGEHLVLAAKAQKIDTCWIGWFKEKRVKKILKVPRNIKIVSLLSMGYSADDLREQPEKHPIDKIYNYNKWK